MVKENEGGNVYADSKTSFWNLKQLREHMLCVKRKPELSRTLKTPVELTSKVQKYDAAMATQGIIFITLWSLYGSVYEDFFI